MMYEHSCKVREVSCLRNCATKRERERERERESVRVSNSTTVCWQRRAQGCCLWVSYCIYSHHSDYSWGLWTPVDFPYFGFSTWISCVPVLHSWFVIVFLSLHIDLDLCTRVHTRVKRLWPVAILTSGIRAIEDSFGAMFKLTGSNYSVSKSKMRDMLVCKDSYCRCSLEIKDQTRLMHRLGKCCIWRWPHI